jgi:ADP-ribose pyrophosphatase YjhB (NUDIX family)
MTKYPRQKRYLFAIDCVIFGFDGTELKLLLVKRAIEPLKDKWSLPGGFVDDMESADEAASRVLKERTGISGVYMEQLQTFSKPKRDIVERTISTAYFALVDIKQYKEQMNSKHNACWTALNKLPSLIFDHSDMVMLAKQKLRNKASTQPILFELMPVKFTIPQLQQLYKDVYGADFDKGNFSRKVTATSLLVRQKDKDMNGSKKGAFYYKVDMRKYNANTSSFMNIIPKLAMKKATKTNAVK